MEHQQWMAATYCVLGRLLTLMLHPTQAIQTLEAGLLLAHTPGSAWWMGNIRTHLSLAYLLKHENAQARSLLEVAIPADAHPRNLAERRMLWAWDYQETLRIAEHLLASPPGAGRAQPIPWLLKLKGEALAAMARLPATGTPAALAGSPCAWASVSSHERRGAVRVFTDGDVPCAGYTRSRRIRPVGGLLLHEKEPNFEVARPPLHKGGKLN